MCGASRRTIVLAMTETTHDDPVPPLPPPPGSIPPQRGAPRLVRDPDDKVVAGVCAAFGRYTDTDPVLWRVTIAVLTLFGGAGLVLYALGWLLVPRRGEAQSFAERTLRRPDRGMSAAGVLLVVAAAVVLLAVLDDGPGFGALLVIAGVGNLVFRERRDSHPASPGAVPPGPPYADVPSYDAPTPTFETAAGSAPYESAPYEGAPGTTAPFTATPFPSTPFPSTPYAATPWDAAPVRRPRRRRSPLGALTLSAATLVAGVLLALRLSGVDALTPERILAVALLVVGGGLLVGAHVGRARWLIPVGLLLAAALALTSAARGAGLDDGVGQRSWTPVAGGTYDLGAGEAVLDLRDVQDGARLDAGVGVGSLVVLVPPGVEAVVEAEVGIGEIARAAESGRRTVLTSGDETELSEDFVVGSGDRRVELDLEVGMGEIEVRRGAA